MFILFLLKAFGVKGFFSMSELRDFIDSPFSDTENCDLEDLFSGVRVRSVIELAHSIALKWNLQHCSVSIASASTSISTRSLSPSSSSSDPVLLTDSSANGDRVGSTDFDRNAVDCAVSEAEFDSSDNEDDSLLKAFRRQPRQAARKRLARIH